MPSYKMQTFHKNDLVIVLMYLH